MSTKFSFIMILATFPVFLFAQPHYQENDKYLNFEIHRTSFISGGYFLRDGLAMEAGIGIALNDEINSNGLGIRLGLDKYFGEKRLATLCGGTVRFEINPNALEQTFWKGSRLILGGQFGINYFILKHLSLAGTLGGDIELNSPKDSESSTNFTTFTSGLKIRFFF